VNIRTNTIPIPAERLAEATDWLVRLRESVACADEMSAWLEWCAAHPQNLDAFDRVQSLDDGLRSLKGAARDSFIELSPPLRPHPEPGVVRRRQTLLVGALAAMVACLGVVGLTWIMRAHTTPSEFSTKRGSQREVTLTDRSRVMLGAASAVSTRYSKSSRRLVLEGGEAFFEVQPDRARPFIVDAGPVSVTAVGTKFDIRRTRQVVMVTVTEGTVDVAPQGTAVPVRVQAGQRAIQDLDTHRLAVAAIDIKAALGWQKGRLEYVAEPLGSVIEDVNRYAARPIIVEAGAVRGLVYSGTVFSERADEWARALDSVFPLTVVTRGDGSVLLTSKSGK